MLADLGEPLRTVLFPAFIEDNAFITLLPPRHPGTHLLPGSNVDMIGPVGKGFEIGSIDNLLLVAEDRYLPPLLPLLRAATGVALIVEATTRAMLPQIAHIPPAVELYMVTRDGSAGLLGPLESESPAPTGLERAAPHFKALITWAECIILSCAPERYPALAAMVRKTRLSVPENFAQALVQVTMPCGIGACEACRVKTKRGERRACTDGPVFNLLDFDGVE